MAEMISTGGEVVLRLRPHLLGWFLRLRKPLVAIDGGAQDHGWHERRWRVEPGTHTVAVVLRHARATYNPRRMTVTVNDGDTVTLRYVGPAGWWGIGSVRTIGVAPGQRRSGLASAEVTDPLAP